MQRRGVSALHSGFLLLVEIIVYIFLDLLNWK